MVSDTCFVVILTEFFNYTTDTYLTSTDLIYWHCKKYLVIVQTLIWSKKHVYFENKYKKMVTITEFVDGNPVFEFIRIKEF